MSTHRGRPEPIERLLRWAALACGLWALLICLALTGQAG